MPITAGLSYAGGLLGSFGQVLLMKRQQDQAQKTKDQQNLLEVIRAAADNPNLDPQSLKPLLEQFVGQQGGKGGKGKSGKGVNVADHLVQALQAGHQNNLIGPAQTPGTATAVTPPAGVAGPTVPAQPVAPTPTAQPEQPQTTGSAIAGLHFYTPEERSQQAATATGQKAAAELSAKRLSVLKTARAYRQESGGTMSWDDAIALAENRPEAHVSTRVDKNPVQQPNGSWVYYVRDSATNQIVGTQPAQAPVDKGPIGQYETAVRSQHPEYTDAEVKQVAATEWQQANRAKLQQAGARIGAYMALSNSTIQKNQAVVDQMQQLMPYTLAAKEAGLQIAQQKVLTAGKIDPVKVVAQATTLAHQLAQKEGTFSALLPGHDEATIRQGLIQELSGGEDPEVVEQEAREGHPAGASTPKAPAGRVGRPAVKVGDVVVGPDGKHRRVTKVNPDGSVVAVLVPGS